MTGKRTFTLKVTLTPKGDDVDGNELGVVMASVDAFAFTFGNHPSGSGKHVETFSAQDMFGNMVPVEFEFEWAVEPPDPDTEPFVAVLDTTPAQTQNSGDGCICGDNCEDGCEVCNNEGGQKTA